MKRLVPSGAVLLTLIVAVALVAPQSASATSLALKPGHYTFVCDSGTNVLQLNGKAVTKAGVPVKCSDMNT